MASIKCGNCGQTHYSVFDVKMCYSQPEDTRVELPEVEETSEQLPVKAAHAKVEGQGMFRHNGKVYKVQKAVHGSGNLYAKILVHGTFEFAKGMIAKLDESERMTLEEAKEYGKLTGSCCNCGRELTNPDSVAQGIGPICAGKDYWG